jgi:uncharacterized protein YbaR (Trm112 family)
VAAPVESPAGDVPVTELPEEPMVVELAPELLEILACPNCHGALAVDHERDELICLAADCGLAYPVRNGIPVLLIDEARRPEAPLRGDHDRDQAGVDPDADPS